MRKAFGFGLTILAALVIQAKAQDHAPLRLVQTIPIPKIQGRFDHIEVDAEGKRLFVAGVESGSIEMDSQRPRIQDAYRDMLRT